METLKFAFLLALFPILVVGGLVSLFALGALFDALDNPTEVGDRLRGLLHPPLAPAKMAGPSHYYRPYWS